MIQRWNAKHYQPEFIEADEGDFVLYRHHAQQLFEAHMNGYRQALSEINDSLEEMNSLFLALYNQIRRSGLVQDET